MRLRSDPETVVVFAAMLPGSDGTSGAKGSSENAAVPFTRKLRYRSVMSILTVRVFSAEAKFSRKSDFPEREEHMSDKAGVEALVTSPPFTHFFWSGQ